MNGVLPLWLREKSRGLSRDPLHTNHAIAKLFLGPSCARISSLFLQSLASALSPWGQAPLAVCLEGGDKLISTQVRLPEYCLRPHAFPERLCIATRDNPLTQRIGAKR